MTKARKFWWLSWWHGSTLEARVWRTAYKCSITGCVKTYMFGDGSVLAVTDGFIYKVLK